MSDTGHLVIAAVVVSGVAVLAFAESREALLSCKPVALAAESEIRGCATRDARGQLRIESKALARLHFAAGGLSAVWVDGVLLHVSRAGRTAVAFPFDNGADYLVEGLTRVLVNGKVGFVDAKLAEVVPPTWDFASPFEGGVATVCLGCSTVEDGEHATVVGGRWGYIDRQDRMIVPVTFAKHELPSAAEARRRLRSGR